MTSFLCTLPLVKELVSTLQSIMVRVDMAKMCAVRVAEALLKVESFLYMLTPLDHTQGYRTDIGIRVTRRCRRKRMMMDATRFTGRHRQIATTLYCYCRTSRTLTQMSR